MSLISHKVTLSVCAAAFLLAGATTSTARVKPPLPAPTTVNCAAGQSINAAIADGYTVITVRGQCNEVVEIAVDNIWLLSHASVPGSIRSSVDIPLNILGADGIIVNGIEIEALGGVLGAVFVEHASAYFQDVDLIGGAGPGLEARRNASVTFNNGSITGFASAAIVTLSSNLSLNSSEISNVANGAIASRGSFLQVQGTTVEGTVASGAGVSVFTGSGAEITSGSVISGFGLQGALAIGGSLRITASTISGNGFSAGPAIYPGQGGVLVASGSDLDLGQSTSVTGNAGYGIAFFDGSGGNCGSKTLSGNSIDAFSSPGSEASFCTP